MILLFTGTETFDWGDQQWAELVSYAKQNGIDGLIVKVYEITQGEWYGGHLPSIAASITGARLLFVPYGYHYGNMMQEEIAAARKYLSIYGVYCADMEKEWDGAAGKVVSFVTGMHDHPGELWVSTWANVADHRWLDNIQVMKQVVDVWMPQAYSNKLYDLMLQQWPMMPQMEPTFSILGDGDPNRPDLLVSNFNGLTISIWEYQTARQNPSLLNMITHMQAQDNGSQRKANDTWFSTDALLRKVYGAPAIPNSGIYKAWVKVFMQGSYNFGGPTTLEIDTVTWDRQPIKLQYFQSGYRAEWGTDNRCRFYSPANILVETI